MGSKRWGKARPSNVGLWRWPAIWLAWVVRHWEG